jgi:propionyl-CoA synthetase
MLRSAALAAGKAAACVPVLATDPLYILYTSGTTGHPKGVVRDNGGHLVALKWSMFNLYGVKPGEVWWCGSDIGWVVGHSYIVYGPLIHGATSIMYEGKRSARRTPARSGASSPEHKAVALFTAPTAFRAIRKDDPDGAFIRKYDLSKFRTLFLAGERADPPTVEWAEAQLKVPVIDHWWQTETGWCIAGNPVGLGHAAGQARLADGADAGLSGRRGRRGRKPVAAGTMGSIVIKLPMPPACLPTLWEQDARFKEAYLTEFPGYYKTSDAGYKDEDGYVWVMGRTDDIINVAGHRLPPAAWRNSGLASDVAECACSASRTRSRARCPCGFLVLKAGVHAPPVDIEKEIVALVRDKLGPVAAFKLAITVGRLPKTRSGKILRGTIKKIADGESWTMPARSRTQGARRNRRRAEGQGVRFRLVMPGLDPGIHRLQRGRHLFDGLPGQARQ